MKATVNLSRQTYAGALAEAGGRELHVGLPDAQALSAVLYASPPYDVIVPPLSVSRLSINMSQARVEGNLEGERPREFLARRHSLFLTPAGAGVSWHKTSSSRHINIYFRADTFDGADEASCASVLADPVPLLNASLPGAGPLFDMLAAELTVADRFCAEAVDSLARLILVRLARRPAKEASRANPLTPALQARLLDYIASRLDRRLLVKDMAAVTGLAPSRFAQSFVRIRGQTPHQFVLHLRLERALQLLRGSTHTLADIAAVCGFASQQHMTQVMRRRLATTPARQRENFASAPVHRT